MIRTELWTDGSGLASGGPGGWAFVLRAIDEQTGEVLKETEGSGGIPEATNNRAELTAVIEGLLVLSKPTSVVVYTDSEYVCKPIWHGWLARWELGNWRTREGEQVRHQDLWKTLADAASIHSIEFKHVKGHLRAFRCDSCGWEGDEAPRLKKNARRRVCPVCKPEETHISRFDRWPLNARCDVLAGEERRKLTLKAAA